MIFENLNLTLDTLLPNLFFWLEKFKGALTVLGAVLVVGVFLSLFLKEKGGEE